MESATLASQAQADQENLIALQRTLTPGQALLQQHGGTNLIQLADNVYPEDVADDAAMAEYKERLALTLGQAILQALPPPELSKTEDGDVQVRMAFWLFTPAEAERFAVACGGVVP